jgi:hypothetical protein
MPQINKENQKITTCNQLLDLEALLGFWPIMAKNLPGHWTNVNGIEDHYPAYIWDLGNPNASVERTM